MFFTLEKIENQLNEIRETIYKKTIDISRFKFKETAFGEEEKEAYKPEFQDADWVDFHVGESWGGYDRSAWFRTTVKVPEEWKKERVVLQFQVGPRDGGGSTAETLLYVNGQPLQGIDIWHEEAWLPAELLKEEELHIALKAWSGVLDVPESRRFKLAKLAIVDQSTERYYHLAHTVLNAIKEVDENDLRHVRMLKSLNDSILEVDFIKKGSELYYQSIERALKSLEGFFNEVKDLEEIKPKVTGIGHAHIDMGWLWRVAHSREKASRTFSTVLHLMDQYPEYRYIHTSPQLYKYLKEDYPEIYSRIKEQVASGKWEITGGMWVEPDTNIPNGESLIRQILFGKRFIKKEFNVDTKVVWLPDVFGYSAALPQIMKKSGIETFMTTKISWSQYNRFPYDTFNWIGLDGTEILTHFITTPERGSRQYTYNGMIEPYTVKGVWDEYNQKDINEELLVAFGWGDGGGGPTKEMIESAQAMKSLPGIPNVSMDTSENYFERLRDNLKGKEIPQWDGELYLEYHRGTYTSQAALKKANRKVEILYHNAEWLSSLAKTVDSESKYPHEELNEGWELILLNQFHDILPGSSIRQVNEDARGDYEKAIKIGENVLEQAIQTITNQMAINDDSLVVFNPESFDRRDFIEIPVSETVTKTTTIEDESGNKAVTQVVDEGENEKVLLQTECVPGLGYKSFKLTEAEETQPDIVVEKDRLENPYYKITLNEFGQFTSIYDKKNNRELLEEGEQGNVLQTFEDKPMNFDAWDIDIYYSEKSQEIKQLKEIKVIESGPIRGKLMLQWEFYDSTITQHIMIYKDSPRIDFKTFVDWEEKQTLLKVAFPVEIRTTIATYHVQFGAIERPTHWNTSWDYARFEVSGHKWVDLSEGDFGIALLNDSKYGYDVKENVMRLTLLKSSIAPDETADRGKHEFTYSLYPHQGDWREGKVLEESYKLNNPLLSNVLPKKSIGHLGSDYQFVKVDSDHVRIETVKKSEDDDSLVVRVYETQQRSHSNVTVEFAEEIQQVKESNLVEEEFADVAYEEKRIRFSIKPYEIKTFKVWF